MADEVLPWCTEGSLDVQGERAQTPSAGPLKHRQLQDVFVQMHGDICSQFIWVVMKQLRANERKKRRFLQVNQRSAVQPQKLSYLL